MKTMKKIFIPIAVLTLLAACSNKESDKKLNDFAQMTFKWN